MITDVDVRNVVDDARFSALHWQVLIICFATAVVDGFDNQMIGFSASAMSADLGIPISSFGAIFSAGAAGALVGAMFLGMLADRIGRKNSLLVCTMLFTVLTLLTTQATSATQLLALRFLAGLGLGGAMPGFLTIVSEYAPKAHRALATGVLWCGYPIGGMMGGALGSNLIPAFGWQTIFYLGGGMSVVVIVAQWVLLPESLQFLALRTSDQAQIKKIVRRLDPSLDVEQAKFFAESLPSLSRVPLAELFSAGRLRITLFLWLPLFCTFMITNFFVLWGPVLFRQYGHSISVAAMMVALNNFAAVPSQAVTGLVIDKAGPFKLVAYSYCGLAAAVVTLAVVLDAVPLIAAMMIVIGFLQGPGIAGMVYLATRIYPAHIRSTGVGWAMGVGRSGQIVGSLVVGWVVGVGLPVPWIFFAMSGPAVVAMLSVLLLKRRLSHAGVTI